MKITGTPPIELNPAAPKRSASTAGPATRGSSSEASVVVTTSAASASAAQSRADADVEQRIQVLRTSISAGTYQVDKDRLASRLVDEERARAG